MKKVFCLLMAIAAAMSLSIPAFAAEYGSLVVLGDSIASGYGLPNYTAGNNYSAKDSFGNKLGAKSASYANFAVDGRTTEQLLTAIDSTDISDKIKNADNVVVSIGGNDYLVPLDTTLMDAVSKDEELAKLFTAENANPSEADVKRLTDKLQTVIADAMNKVDIDKTYDNLNGIFGKIRKLNPDCKIVTFTVYNPFEGNANMAFFDKTSQEMLNKLNTRIYAAAGINSVEVIDVYSLFKGKPRQYTNIAIMDVHPSKDGHALMYSKLASALPSVPSADKGNSPSDDNPETGSCVAVMVTAAAVCIATAVSAKKRK